MRRPLVILTAAYCAGIAAARLLYPLPRDLLMALVFLAGLAGVLLFWVLRRFLPSRPLVYALLPLLFSLSLAQYQAAVLVVQGNLASLAGERVVLEGVVAAEPLVYADRVVYLLEVQRAGRDDTAVAQGAVASGAVAPGAAPPGAGGQGNLGNAGGLLSASGRIRLVADLEPEGEGPPGGEGGGFFSYGDRLRVRGKLTFPTGPRNPGGFDYTGFLLSQGAGAQLYLRPGQGQVLPPAGAERAGGLLLGKVFSLKNRTLGLFRENLLPEQAALLGGILFGLRSGLPSGVEENFRASGASHLLAVSGLHLGLVAFLAAGLLGLLGLKGERALLFTLPAAAAFTLFAGFRPAVLRAFLMLVILAVSQGLGRDRDFPSALALSALVSLLINPFFLFMPGFQLSYAGIAAIIYLHEDLTPLFSFLPEFLRKIAAASLAAQLGVAPLTAYYFQQVSLVALLTNLVLVAAMTPLLGGALAGSLLALLWPWGAGMALKLLSPLLYLFLAVTRFFSSLPLASLAVPHLPAAAVFLAYAVLLAWVNRRKLGPWRPTLQGLAKKHLFPLLLALSLLAAAGLAGEVRKERLLEVTFLDVGQGASVFIQTPGGRNLLVDTGGALFPHSRDPGKDVLLPFLRHRKVKSLDLLCISHPHVDHYGGVPALLDAYPPSLLAVGSPSGEEGYLGLLQQARAKSWDVKLLSRGSRLPLETGLELRVLHPPKGRLFSGSGAAENNNSLVLKLTYHRISFLFTGDIEEEGERLLLEGARDLRSTFLQVPHHGSNTSSSAAFLKEVKPAVAVIPVGANPFGHPASGVLGRLAAEGVEVYRTDWHGAVTVQTDGYRYGIRTMLAGPAAGKAAAAPMTLRRIPAAGAVFSR